MFFEIGKKYLDIDLLGEGRPEQQRVFHCIAVAPHPNFNSSYAFGFIARNTPGNDWYPMVMSELSWGSGVWVEAEHFDEKYREIERNTDGND